MKLILMRQIITRSLINNEKNIVNLTITNDQNNILIKDGSTEKVIGKLNIDKLEILKKTFLKESDILEGKGSFELEFLKRKLLCSFDLTKPELYIKIEEIFENKTVFNILNEVFEDIGLDGIENKYKYIIIGENKREEGVYVDFIYDVIESIDETLSDKFYNKLQSIKNTMPYAEFALSENQVVLDTDTNTLWFYKKSNRYYRQKINSVQLRNIKSNKELKMYFVNKNFELNENITLREYDYALQYIKERKAINHMSLSFSKSKKQKK